MQSNYETNFVCEQLFRFGEKLESARLESNLPVSAIARDLGISRNAVYAVLAPTYTPGRDILAGQVRMPSLQRMIDIAAYLDHEFFLREFGGCQNIDEANGESLHRVLGSSSFNLGVYLTERRQSLDLFMTDVASLTGTIDKKTIWLLEKNSRPNIGFDTLSRILSALRLEVDVRPATLEVRNSLDFGKPKL